MKTFIKEIALAVTVFGVSSMAVAAEKQSFRVTVDVSMPMHKMYADIKSQARRQCLNSARQSVLVKYNAAVLAACQEKMVNDVIKSLDLPRLTTIHQHVIDTDIKTS